MWREGEAAPMVRDFQWGAFFCLVCKEAWEWGGMTWA